MSANVVPFRSSGSCARHKKSPHAPPADLLQQSEALREARRKLFECWAIRAESRRIKRGYEARQKKIKELMDGLGI